MASWKERRRLSDTSADLKTFEEGWIARAQDTGETERLREAVRAALGGYEAIAEAETKCGRLSGSQVLAIAADDESKRLIPILRAALAAPESTEEGGS